MLDLLRKFFEKNTIEGKEEDITYNIQVATCSLMLEIANIDGEFSSEEQHKIITMLKDNFQLSDAALAETFP